MLSEAKHLKFRHFRLFGAKSAPQSDSLFVVAARLGHVTDVLSKDAYPSLLP
jgi:hypothetical protein